MTIQNIDDVMDRIMSLNRNLTVDSLKTLLSASGWDKEDISEGVRIFKSRDKNSVLATPIESYVNKNDIEGNKASNFVDIDNDNVKNDDFYKSNIYNFNLNKNQEQKEEQTLKKEEEQNEKPVLNLDEKNDNSYKFNVLNYKGNTSLNKESEENTINKINTNNNILENNIYLKPNINETSQTTTIRDKKKHYSISKLFFFIFFIFILLIIIAYLLLPNFRKITNKKLDLVYENTIHKIGIIFNKKDIPYENNFVTIPNSQNLIYGIYENSSTTSSTTSSSSPTFNVNDLNLKDLESQILELKNELENYKNNGSQSQTIIKYISQIGPTGRTGDSGRGISFVSATNTGFIINYTDGSNNIIPYSTTTIVNIINSNSLCFRDASSSTPSSTDLCIDKSVMTDILNQN